MQNLWMVTKLCGVVCQSIIWFRKIGLVQLFILLNVRLFDRQHCLAFPNFRVYIANDLYHRIKRNLHILISRWRFRCWCTLSKEVMTYRGYFKRYTNKHSARCSALIVFVRKYYSNDHVKFGLW